MVGCTTLGWAGLGWMIIIISPLLSSPLLSPITDIPASFPPQNNWRTVNHKQTEAANSEQITSFGISQVHVGALVASGMTFRMARMS